MNYKIKTTINTICLLSFSLLASSPVQYSSLEVWSYTTGKEKSKKNEVKAERNKNYLYGVRNNDYGWKRNLKRFPCGGAEAEKPKRSGESVFYSILKICLHFSLPAATAAGFLPKGRIYSQDTVISLFVHPFIYPPPPPFFFLTRVFSHLFLSSAPIYIVERKNHNFPPFNNKIPFPSQVEGAYICADLAFYITYE